MYTIPSMEINGSALETIFVYPGNGLRKTCERNELR